LSAIASMARAASVGLSLRGAGGCAGRAGEEVWLGEAMQG
jgi:hypothetical protein